MFCTKCGKKLEVIHDCGTFVGYCPNCSMEVELLEPVKAGDEMIKEKSSVKKVKVIVKKGLTLFDGFLDRKIEKQITEKKREEAKLKHQQKCEQDVSIQLTFIFGYQIVGISQHAYLRQKRNGIIYFDYNDTVLFRLVSYEWGGAEYVTVSNGGTLTEAEHSEYSKKSGRGLAVGAGAIAGGMIASDLGAIVGAAAGASGPRRVRTQENSSERTTSSHSVEDLEKDTQAQLVIKNVVSNEVYRLMIVCNRTIDGMIRCLDWSE